MVKASVPHLPPRNRSSNMGSPPSVHIPQQMSGHSEINHSVLQHTSTMVSGKEDEVAFPAGNDDYRAQRLRCAKACRDYNNLPEDALPEERERYYYRIVGEDKRLPDHYSHIDNIHLQKTEENRVFANAPYIKQPLHVDYGNNLHIGEGTFINRGCFIADTPVAPVRIGSQCAFGPGVHIYSVSHPLEYEERLKGIAAPSFGSEIVVGDGCWIGGGAIVLPGVHIGKGCVIGAGSVVTRDVPDFHLAVGVPARTMRKVSEGECKQSCCKKTTNRSEVIRMWYAAALPFMVVFIGAALQWAFRSLVMHGKGC